MFEDDADFPPFRPKPRGLKGRVTISSHASRSDLTISTAAGPMRLYITTSVVVEIDDDSCAFDEFSGEPAARSTRRLPPRTKR